MRNALAFVLLLALPVVGSAAKLLTAPGSGEESQSEYAPVNATDKPGLVRYKASGFPTARRRHRDEAYKLMYETCKGKYRIVGESSETKTIGMDRIGNADVADNVTYINVEFVCVSSQEK